jgi:glycopeptide antibiotics resistance protein
VGTYLAWFLAAVPGFLWLAAMIALLSGIIAWWRARRLGWRAALNATLPDTVLLVALAAIVVLTLGRPLDPQVERVNLIPFRDLLWALDGQVELAVAVTELVANVLLFVPLGSALAVRHPGASTWWIAGVAAAVSLAVEVAQAVMDAGRLADVTDVLANTIGAAVGAMLWGLIISGGRADQGSPTAPTD